MNGDIMKKNTINKIITGLLLVLVAAITFSTVFNKTVIDADANYKKYKTNNFFNTELTEPDVESELEEFVSMADLYAGIKTRIDNVAESSDAAKIIADASIVTWINGLVNPVSGSKRVSISTPLELYQFGNAQSINFESQGGVNTFIFENTIQKVLSLDYVLLNDINYSAMKSQKFIPIGTNIDIELGEEEEEESIKIIFPFNGTFDGNGFEISNLYLADYSYISTTFSDEDDSSAITVGLFQHYAMFSLVGSSGVIKNLILRNPSFELIVIDDSSGIFSFSTFVGENNGLIYNVGVIDKKVNTQGVDTSGITFTMLYPSTLYSTAAGFVHTNAGTIKNSYFVGKNIIVNQSLFRFSQVAPFVHTNTGTLEGVAFEDIAIVKPSGFYPEEEYIEEYSESDLKNENETINSGSITDDRKWYFYPSDGYPILIGLEYVNGEYEINNDLDFLTFTKLLSLNSEINGKTFDSHTYVLKNHINMSNIKGYKPPSKEFKGILKGGNVDFQLGDSSNNNKYIFNLTINEPLIVGNKYYMGLFSSLSGTVQNINFYNNQIIVTNSSKDYGKIFYIGTVAGELKGGTVKNVISNSTIDLGTEPLGLTYAGGIIGYSITSGNQNSTLTYVANTGEINGNTHNFDSKGIAGSFYVGGLAGTNTGNMTISFSVNKGKVTGVGSTSSNYDTVGSVNTFTGGIIGEINNTTQNSSKLVYLSNFGEINANKFVGGSGKAYQYLGGIFGSVRGFGFKLNDGNEVRNGGFENDGLIKGQFTNNDTYLYAAGIGVANTTAVLAKISYMANHKGYEILNLNYQTHNTNIFYAATIVDNSTNGIELSRAYSYVDYTFGTTYFNSISGQANPSQIRIAPFFTSVNDTVSKLLYVENAGDLQVGEEGSDTSVIRLLKVSNITQANKIDYFNVTNSGDIKVLRINNTNDSIYVAGITWILAHISRSFIMENVVNEGNIYTAGIIGNTTVDGTVTGTAFSHTSFYGNLNVRNLYVGGIVNINAGEITNVFNLGNITSKYNESVESLYDIKGTANTFVGGIVTFNYNLIQDAANSGLMEYTNSSTSSVSYFAANVIPSSGSNSSIYGGISITYTGGVVLGGIAGAFGDVQGTELQGYVPGFSSSIVARVLDTTNNGDIYGKAKEYVRSGGILGIALSVELASGTYENTSTRGNITAGPFTKVEIGSEDPVGKSILSNGLNYGNIYAITQTIGNYGNTHNEGTGDLDSNAIRPGINASAGGVIAYGLTVMVRMLNHGVVSSTDVAGGVVGATYILGGTSQSATPVTTVTINTAVHYGKIKAIKQSYYSGFVYAENENFNNTTKYYEDGNTSFIFAGTGTRDKARYQNGRRGFGGIFGRLQRGRYGTMSSTEFNNIMNMDPNIDMVGRVDSNTPGSLVYYRFFTGTDTYYTAKENDTTPNALVGWNNTKNIRYDFTNANVTFTVNRSGNSSNYVYYVTNILVSSIDTVVKNINGEKTVMRPNRTSVNTANYSLNIERNLTGEIYSGTSNSTNFRVANFGIANDVNTSTGATFPQTIIKPNYTHNVTLFNYTGGTTSNPGSDVNLRYPVIKVSDSPTDYSSLYIFDPSFPLMATENSEYIYAVNPDALAPRFKADGTNPKLNGMYVLASSTGSLDGATLPTNIKMNNFLKLKEDDFGYIDLENVGIGDRVIDDDFYDHLFEVYEDMYQLSYNNKAEILPEVGAPTIADLVLYDPTGHSPILTKGTVNYNVSPKTITFTLSTTAFSDNALYYEVLSNELSNNAVIARDGITTGQLIAFYTDYTNRINSVLPSTSGFKFTATTTLGSAGTNRAEFDIKVYSEINIRDSNIFALGKYTETYKVIVVRETRVIETSVDVIFNGSQSQTQTLTNIPASASAITYSVNPNGSLDVRFTGYGSNTANRNAVNALIPVGHEMVVHNIKLVEGANKTIIAPAYYNLTINPKGFLSTDLLRFGFLIEFDDRLQAGSYEIEYSYYMSSTHRTLTVNKASSTSYDIVEMEYEYFSNDLLGEEDAFVRNSFEEFTTYVEFGYEFESVTTTPQDLDPDMNDLNTSELDYLDDISYDLYLGEVKLITIKLAPFARLNSAKISYDYVGGKRRYIVTYNILNEAETPRDTTHYILERDLDPMLVYLDDNYQAFYEFTITREASSSKIGVDFNFINNSLYEDVVLNVESSVNPTFEYTDAEIFEGNHQGMFIFYITGLLDRGEYTYYFSLKRDKDIYYDLGYVVIEKLKGVNAYLLDIKFTLDDEEILFEYPYIRVTDSGMNVDNNYDPRIYADGIDYGLALDAGKEYFKIDGKVADIVLEYYHPRFFLPYGATIERYDEIEKDWVEDLYDDFAGEEDDSEKVVQYRITSEDGENEVYYFITARDIKYNLTLRFTIYFELADGTLVAANDSGSAIKNNVLLISLKSLKLDGHYLADGITSAGFPELEGENIIGINNQASLYYFIANSGTINYRFGRNTTGGFNFNIITPIYTGGKTTKLTPGERYYYEMYMMPRGMTMQEWHSTTYQLPYMSSISSEYSGLYYFITSPSPYPITRDLAIVIKAETKDHRFGLNDEYNTWD